MADVEINARIKALWSTFQLVAFNVLHDEFGFGANRLDVFRRETWRIVEMLNEERVSAEDLESVVLDEIYKGKTPFTVDELIKQGTTASNLLKGEA